MTALIAFGALMAAALCALACSALALLNRNLLFGFIWAVAFLAASFGATAVAQHLDDADVRAEGSGHGG